MAGAILIAVFCLLTTSEALFLSARPSTTFVRHQSLLSASTTPSQDASIDTSESISPSFWGSEHTTEEIIDFVSGAMLSVDPTLTPRVEIPSAEPPLVIMHNFISSDDCDSIIQATQEQEMQRSTMGATQEESQERTSSTAWLSELLCEAPLRRLAEKTSVISQLPPSHMENLQVVNYQPGQEFQLHTDHLDSFNDLRCRGRLATCLIYLSPPEEGGETSFPEFKVEVPPTKGSAVFFWNTVERPGMEGYDPDMFLHVEPKLRHAGLPVLKGEKWICNRWMHPIEFGAGVRGTAKRDTV